MISADPEGAQTRKMLMRMRAWTGERYEFLWDSKIELATLWEKARETSEVLRDLRTERTMEKLSPKTRSMLKLLTYLGLAESLGGALIDMGLVILIASGKDMHIGGGRGIMHVSKMKELRELNLAYKMRFLDNHKLGYFAKVIDRQLRNDIAHLKFEIKADGTILNSSGQVVNIDDTISGFWARVSTIISFLEDAGFKDMLEKKTTE